MVVYWLFRLTIFVMRPLPLWAGYRIASAVAGVCYHFFGRQRRALNENLAWVLESDDPKEVDRVAKRAFRNFGKFVIDFIHFPAMTQDEVRRRLVFAQWHDLDDLVEEGKGVLIVTIHLGVWDLGAASLATYGFKVNAIVDRFSHEGMNELIHGSRERLGVKVIQMNRVGPAVFRALKRGEMLALLIDVPSPSDTIVVDFLGAPAEVSSAPARLALRTGARVMPAVVLRGPQSDTMIRPIVDAKSVRYERTGDEEADVRNLTQQIMTVLEKQVRAHPDQWYIFRPMWPDRSKETASHASTAGT